MIGKLNNLVMNLRILDNSILQKRFQPFLLASTEMILSHKHRFIFLKTRKTAGTSIEIALSKFCDNNDIITRITEQDEVLRSKLGFRGPQNFLVGPSKYTLMDILKIIRNGRLRINNHDPASLLIKYLEKEIFEEYHKFTVVRNPWDMAVSMYYWQINGPSNQFSSKMSFKDFINNCPIELLDNSLIYLVEGESIIDTFIKFENLTNDWRDLVNVIGIEEIDLPRAKTDTRKDKRHYSIIYDDEDVEFIRNLCGWEIENFGYEFEDKRS